MAGRSPAWACAQLNMPRLRISLRARMRLIAVRCIACVSACRHQSAATAARRCAVLGDRYARAMTSIPSPRVARAPALVGWRLLALCYDAWPVLALSMLISTVFTLGFTLAGHPARENIAPFSGWQWLLWLCCWIAAGIYATVSWRRGGQTLGMRPGGCA